MAVLAASGPIAIVASGDMGSMGPPATTCPALFPSYGLPGQASVNWLAASPGVTAVGGTMWPGFLRHAEEPAWNQAAGVGPVRWACGSAGWCRSTGSRSCTRTRASRPMRRAGWRGTWPPR